jgi:peptide/nickel transport system substrate-binding protein/microcin C transport system substrate-binding protein
MRLMIPNRWSRGGRLAAGLCLLLAIAAATGCRARVEKKDTLRLATVKHAASLIERYGQGFCGPAFYSLVQEPLLDAGGNEPAPRLARRWELGEDRVTCSFWVDEMAQWSDGTRLTAEDVAFTFKAVLDASNGLFGGLRAMLGPVEWFRAEDARLFRVRMKFPHYANLIKAGSIPIMPRHIYGTPGEKGSADPWTVHLGSGPYLVVTNDSTRWILKKDGDYWAQSNNRVPHLKDYYIFDRLVIRTVKDEHQAADLFRQGELDLLEVPSRLFERWDKPKSWTWTNTNVVRLEREAPPMGCWDGVALNLRQGPLRDWHFRRALQNLIHREIMAEKLFKGRWVAAAGPFAGCGEYEGTATAQPFDLEGARRMLASIGYVRTNKGVLEREYQDGGKRFVERASVELLLGLDGESDNRWAKIFVEEAQKAGVEIRVKKMEWALLRKRLEEGKFEACHFIWEGGLIPQPGLLFAGVGARVPGAYNFGGLDDFQINRLVREAEDCREPQARKDIFRDLEKRVREVQPVLFLFTPKKQLLAWYKQRLAPALPPFLNEYGYGVQIPFWNRWTPVP